MTDTEIIKALECCAKPVGEGCRECPLYKEDCVSVNMEELALDLINRQKAEIEELKVTTGLMGNRKFYNKFVKEVFQKENGSDLIYPDFDEIYKRYFEQQAEIEKLREFCDIYSTEGERAIKEFAKRIKKEASICCKGLFEYNPMIPYPGKGEITTEYHITEDKLDAILKEMVGE